MFEVRENAFYTVAELSPGFSIAVSGVRSWIRKGKLKATKVGRNYMILGKDVLTFIQAGYQDSIPPKKQPHKHDGPAGGTIMYKKNGPGRECDLESMLD